MRVNLHALGLVDTVVPEPLGGAHADPKATVEAVGELLWGQLEALSGLTPEALFDSRYQKFRAMGAFTENAAAPKR